MEWPPHFREALENPPPATLLALLSPAVAPPSVHGAIATLEQCELPVFSASSQDDEVSDSTWQLHVELSLTPDDILPCQMWLETAPPGLAELAPPEFGDPEETLWWVMGIRLPLTSRPLSDYHLMCRLLAKLGGEIVLCHDVDAQCTRPGTWISDIAAASISPAPHHLFAVHTGASPDGSSTLSTHGLNRFGCIDLDVTNVDEDADPLVRQLLTAVAGLFLEHGVPPPCTAFSPGAFVDLAWLPDESVKATQAEISPRGSLVLPRGNGEGELISASNLFRQREGSPLLFVSAVETERMSLMASERLPRFLSLLAEFVNQPDWTFLVKLGLPIDEAADSAQREHLWFEVHEFDGAGVEATLLNEPREAHGMHQGDRQALGLEYLSDWAITCAWGSFNSESIGDLERALARHSQVH